MTSRFLEKICALGILLALVLGCGSLLVTLAAPQGAADAEPSVRLLSTYTKLKREMPQWLDIQQQIQVAAGQAFLAQSNTDMAAASFQSDLKQLIEKSGGTLESMETLSDVQEKRAFRIDAKAAFTIALEHFSSLLKQIDEASPYIFIDAATIKAAETTGAAPVLSVSCTFTAFALPEAR
jgi:hypothetical protein